MNDVRMSVMFLICSNAFIRVSDSIWNVFRVVRDRKSECPIRRTGSDELAADWRAADGELDSSSSIAQLPVRFDGHPN